MRATERAKKARPRYSRIFWREKTNKKPDIVGFFVLEAPPPPSNMFFARDDKRHFKKHFFGRFRFTKTA
jgi:hypothetical protein